MIQDIFKEGTLYLAMGVEGAAALVIGLAALQAVFRALSTFLGRTKGRGGEVRDHIRFDLGRWLALGLEFELAADILRTAVAPTWNEIGQLAAIAVLRTLLNISSKKRSTPPPAVRRLSLPHEIDLVLNINYNCDRMTSREIGSSTKIVLQVGSTRYP